jgi:hypothetical protein
MVLYSDRLSRLDVNPGTRAPGHHSPRAFFFLILLAGVHFLSKKKYFLSVLPLFLSFFLSFSVHTLWVLLSLTNFTKVRCEGKLKKGVYKL